MLKGNLSTRPFYNERLVVVLVMVGVLLGLGLTVFNVTRDLSAVRRAHGSKRERTRACAKPIGQVRAVGHGAAKQSRSRPNLLVLAGATNEANTLIDQRTFSWTDFFGLVEKTLPLDARLMAVAPRVERACS